MGHVFGGRMVRTGSFRCPPTGKRGARPSRTRRRNGVLRVLAASLIVSAGVLVYLFYALLYPERL